MFKDAHMEQMSNACYTVKNICVCMKNAALVNHMGLYEVCNIKDVGSHVMACGPTVARTAHTLKIQLTSCE
jgi:hypothetical protein